MPELTIIMPVFNERATLERAIEDVLETEYPVADYELIVVDDGSTDGTRELLEEGDWPDHIRVLHHDVNFGKGAAVRSGLREARGTWTVTMDADLEYSADDIPKLLQPLLEKNVDATMGVRTFGSHTAYNFWFVIAGKVLTVFMNMLYNRLDHRHARCAKGDADGPISFSAFAGARLRARDGNRHPAAAPAGPDSGDPCELRGPHARGGQEADGFGWTTCNASTYP